MSNTEADPAAHSLRMPEPQMRILNHSTLSMVPTPTITMYLGKGKGPEGVCVWGGGGGGGHRGVAQSPRGRGGAG